MQGGGWYPRAACCGDTVHLVWWQHYAHDEIFYKRSTDCGLTWGPDVLISIEDDKSSVLPWIAVYKNYIHVVWSDYAAGLCYRKSTDNGNSWLPIDTIPNGGGSGPSICAAGSYIYVIGSRSDGKVIFSKSTDNGDNWLPSQNIGFVAASGTRIKTLRPSQSFIIVTCQDDRVFAREIYYKSSADAGSTWSDSVCISEYDSISSQFPAIDTDDSGGVHFCWYDYKYSPHGWTGDIFYRAIKDTSMTEIDSLTVMHRAVVSDILAEGNNLHLVWEDDRHGFDENFEIYYRMSTDLGKSWGAELRLTDSLYHSLCPSLACGGDYLHLFWQDRKEYGNSGPSAPIYYKRKDLSVSISEGDKIFSSLSRKVDTYPNPFSQEIRIGCMTHDAGYRIKDFAIRIYDVSGKEVAYEVKDKGSEIKMDTKGLPCGVYFIQIEAGSERLIKKVVKVR